MLGTLSFDCGAARLTNIREVLQDSALHGQFVEIGIQERRDALRQWRGSFLAHFAGGVLDRQDCKVEGEYWKEEVRPAAGKNRVEKRKESNGGVRSKKHRSKEAKRTRAGFPFAQRGEEMVCLPCLHEVYALCSDLALMEECYCESRCHLLVIFFDLKFSESLNLSTY